MNRNEVQAEILDIIAGFQEGFNTNIHCMELARCITDYIFDELIKKEDR